MTDDPEDSTEDPADSRTNPTAEQRLWRALRGRRLRGWKFRRAPAIADHVVAFACIDATLIIEIDASPADAMSEPNRKKTRVLEKAGFRVIRFTEEAVLAQFEKTMQSIFNAADGRVYQKTKPAVVAKKKAKKTK